MRSLVRTFSRQWCKRALEQSTVRPPRRFYEFRTRVMREIAGKGLKFTENPCETHARAMRNPCEVSRGSRSSRKSAKFARGFLQFPRMMGENFLHR